MADNFVDIAKQFCDFYYQTFDADRKQLGPLYRDQSMLTYESSSVQGVAAIVEKLSVRQLPQPIACSSRSCAAGMRSRNRCPALGTTTPPMIGG